MMRSLFAGVTGLRTHQTRMDVIGNNIANVNTLGFKKSAVTFKDLYSETVSASAAPSGDGSTGGVNPKQIGLGVTLNSITTIHTPGSAQYTGNPMDVAISGDGYFTVLTPTGYKYTRSGNFSLDTAGNLVTADGYYVQTVNPIMTSDTMLIYNKVNTEGLLVANSIISEPASNIHTGNVTDDLSFAMGKEFSFAYLKDGGGYMANINKNYQPSTTAALSNPNINVGRDGDGNIVTMNLQKIADAYLAIVPDGTTPGGKNITFETNLSNDAIIMFVDGMEVAVSNMLVANSGVIDQPTEVRISFGDLGEVVLSCPASDDLGDLEISVQDQIDAVVGLANLPQIPLEESGGWYLMSDGVKVESVAFDYKAPADGVGIASGDIMFKTQNYGSFRLHLDQPVESMQELSNALQSAKFEVDITEEAYVIYESPAGQISENMLNPLQVDFSRYNNLFIDSKGAVVAQLMQDEKITIDGREVDMKLGDKVVLGYIPLANFNNTSGLEKVGDNLYEVGADSGSASYSMPGSGTAGALSPSSIEMSNVDLSEEMVNMIITQRGFQANSRIITVSDTMLEELINLKR